MDPFCDLVQARTWEQEDKHSQAFRLLVDTPAKRELVNRIVGFDLVSVLKRDDQGNFDGLIEPTSDEVRQRLTTAKACFRCHATWPKSADHPQPERTFQRPLALANGVSCEACHGPSQAWNQPHQSPVWRLVKSDVKEQLGLADVRDPIRKARLCASCHVGDLSEDKFVRHEWYAAGHPTLPSFELATFASQMPAHWLSLKEKGNFRWKDGKADLQSSAYINNEGLVRDGFRFANLTFDSRQHLASNYAEANFAEAIASGLNPGNDLPRMKDAVISGAAIFETYVKLVGDYAARAAENKEAWPELALYDCAACHHELRSGLGAGTRPKRSHAPGRPPLSTWPKALAQLAAHQAEEYDKAKAEARWLAIDKQLLQLDRATTDRPFGDPNSMRDAATSLSVALAQLAYDAANTRYDETAAKSALVFLTTPDQYEINDFSTARQAAWALCEISKDLRFTGTDQLFFSGSEDPLALKLPSGQGSSVMENLGRWLPAAAKYDAAEFRKELKATRDVLLSK